MTSARSPISKPTRALLPKPAERCGGKLVGYYMSTKMAGPTNFALAPIHFLTLAAYEN
jgi:hypothetical protein